MTDDTLTRTLLHRIDELELDVRSYRDAIAGKDATIEQLEKDLLAYANLATEGLLFWEDGVCD